jgi:putative transposase
MQKKFVRAGHQQLRKGRVSMPFQIYFVTVVCKNRESHFTEYSVAAATSRKIADCSTWLDAKVLAWVLMPDHYHVLLQLGEITSLQAVMKRANLILALTVNRTSRRQGAVWQSAYHDHAIRKEECVESVARYLVANPLRAKLVADIGQYPYWGAVWLDGRDGNAF